MDIRQRHSSNSSIPTLDNKSIKVDISCTLKSDQTPLQSLISRLPSFHHNRQKLSLSSRKSLSSNVTPISSPIIPRISSNYRQPVLRFSKEGIDTSSSLISEIDVTLSQLSKQYYSGNNNSFDFSAPTPTNDECITPTTQLNNNFFKESCDCEMLNKLKPKKASSSTSSSHNVDKPGPVPATVSSRHSHIPSPFKDSNSRYKPTQAVEMTTTPRPTKLPFGEGSKHSSANYYSIHQEVAHKSSKSSGKRYEALTTNPKFQEDTDNSNSTYTEAWVYNSQLPSTHRKAVDANHDLLDYISKVSTESQNNPQPGVAVYQSSGNPGLFQKSIFTQHRHGRNEASQSYKLPQKIPLPNRNLKNNNEDLVLNRDSGIFSSSCSKESSGDSNSDIKVNNNHIVHMSLPQPPPRISSLAITSQCATARCPTLTNQSSQSANTYLNTDSNTPKQACKADRRKARELFASVKQRDDLRNNSNKTGTQNQDISIKKKEVSKIEVAETPNSDLEIGTAEGYCSDMDNLKNSGYGSDNSGYMSEGGIGLYAQKMQQRFREGLLAVQESLQMTTHKKIVTTRVGSFDRDDISSTSSEEIEDYLKELSSRLVFPSKTEDTKKNKEVFNVRKNSIPRSQGNESLDLQAQRKNRIYEERLERYACDVEPAADFDITSSCSMDLLTGKVVSYGGSEEESFDFKGLRMVDEERPPDTKVSANIYDYGRYTARKCSVDSNLRSRQIPASKPRLDGEILEAAGPTPAIFEMDNLSRIIGGEDSHYRAMSLPGRPRRNSGFQGNTASLSREGVEYSYPLPPPPQNNSVHYDVPVYRNRPAHNNGSSNPSLQNIRLPYATIDQGVRNSISTTSLGKRDVDSDDIYDGLGSHLSLVSAGSYRSLNEERQATEIRKLRRELDLAQQKVRTLSGQLSNNGTLVTAFEDTLHSMSMRLQKFAANSESKESELNDLKNTIDSLKKQAGSSPVHNDPMDHSSPRIFSASSLTSLSGNPHSSEKRSDNSTKKSSWFRTSIGKAFRKKSSKDDGSTESINEIRNKDGGGLQKNVQSMTESESLQALRKELEEKDARLTDVQLDALSRSHQLEQLRDILTKMRYEMSTLKADNSRLQGLMTLSNGAVSTQSLEQSISGDSSENAFQSSTIKSIPKFKDLVVLPKFDFLNDLVKDVECPQPLVVYMVLKNLSKVLPSHNSPIVDEIITIPIGRVGINSKTSWSDLESTLRRLFKEYVTSIDPTSNLGLNGESICRYRINTDTCILLCNSGGMRPLTSPVAACDNIADSKIFLELKNHTNGNSIDDMVFEFLIPKPILVRYLGLLLDHRRIILSGPSGTGKSYLANKLALNLASRYNRDPATSIFVFHLDHKSTKELRGYMTTLTELLLKTDPHGDPCLSSTHCLPLVIIIDNLHHVSSFSEIFNSFLSIHPTRSPFVIGTMTQSNTMTNNNLQLHHNFRWVLCTNHMEPVKGFLGRYLRRQFLKHQLETGQNLDQLFHVIEWISIVWQHINKFLETYSSADVTVGPRLFLSCPMSVEKSRVWFVDLWNYSLVPYVLDAVRDGLNSHGRKQATWDDPTDWIIRSWPWGDLCSSFHMTSTLDTSNLIRLRPEDVGFDSYQLVTTTSAHIGPYSVPAHLGMESLISGRHSATLDRRPRVSERQEHNDMLMGMLYKTQERNQRRN